MAVEAARVSRATLPIIDIDVYANPIPNVTIQILDGLRLGKKPTVVSVGFQ